MFYVSEIYDRPPARFKTALQEKTYRALAELRLPFERVETDEAITMEDCVQIDGKLHMKMVKTLFLCNRQQTALYLFVTAGDRPFRSKDFSAALGVSRVSFAPLELMERLLGAKMGAATVYSALLETARGVQVIFSRDVAAEEWYGCSDGTTTGYMKIRTADVLNRLLLYTGHSYRIIEA